MPALYRINPIEVDNRLEQLGWTRGELLEVVGAMVAARNNCTENDPSSAPGWMAWKEGTRRLREIGRPKGLEKDDSEQVPALLDRARGLKFSVSNTDDGTGTEHRFPQNRNRKGPATERMVAANQGSLFSDDELSALMRRSSIIRFRGGAVSWSLCVFAEGDEVRAELSCPVDVEGGFYTDFSERIVLIGPEDDRGGVKLRYDEPKDGLEFDIQVRRK